MRSRKEIEKILKLRDSGQSHSQIARETKISRSTVRDICNRYAHVSQLAEESVSKTDCWRFESSHGHYAYLLGCYLGDGYISQGARCCRLRITLDRKYPDIIKEVVDAISIIMPNNRVGLVESKGCIDVSCYSKKWPSAFPQSGKGKKHERSIVLNKWQKEIVKSNPQNMMKGLIHSDGCRDSNIINGKSYPRYSFSNLSSDILDIFCWVCQLLDIKYKRSDRIVSIAKREDVEKMDKWIGPKK